MDGEQPKKKDRTEYNRLYHLKHRAEIQERQKKYRAEHNADIARSSCQYHLEHRAEINKRARKRQAARGEEARQYNRKYSHENRAQINARVREHHAEHRTELNERRRRALPLAPKWQRPDLQKASYRQIQDIIGLDLPLDELAKRVGITASALRIRLLKFGRRPELVKSRRDATRKYIFDLRDWVKNQPLLPSLEQIICRNVDELLKGSQVARDFTEDFQYLGEELREHPEAITKLKETRSGTAAITLSSLVFKRARAGGGPNVLKPKRKSHAGHTRGWKTRQTEERNILAAALKCFGLTAYQMAPLLYARQYKVDLEKGTQLAYGNTLKLLKRNGSAIDNKFSSLHLTKAIQIIKAGLPE